MLQALGPGPVEGMVCTPSLLEADYPSSLQDAVEWFRNEDAVEWFRDEPSIIDTEPFVARVLISANTCLIPTSHAFVRYQIAHRPEAIPLHFFLRGYRETYSYEEEMRAFLQSFMGISEARASETISALFQAYEALQVRSCCGGPHAEDQRASRGSGALRVSIGGVGQSRPALFRPKGCNPRRARLPAAAPPARL